MGLKKLLAWGGKAVQLIVSACLILLGVFVVIGSLASLAWRGVVIGAVILLGGLVWFFIAVRGRGNRSAPGWTIHYDCGQCQQTLFVHDAAIGAAVPCAHCGFVMVLPSQSRSIKTKVRGVTFRNADGSDRQAIARSTRAGEILILATDPDNPHDPNAVCVVNQHGQMLGHLSADLASQLADHVGAGRPVSTRAIEVTGGTRGESWGVNLMIRVFDEAA